VLRSSCKHSLNALSVPPNPIPTGNPECVFLRSKQYAIFRSGPPGCLRQKTGSKENKKQSLSPKNLEEICQAIRHKSENLCEDVVAEKRTTGDESAEEMSFGVADEHQSGTSVSNHVVHKSIQAVAMRSR
jgi:hypothetical protein